MTQQSEIRILNDSAGLFQAAAKEFALLASAAVVSKGSFCVALSGGSTPKGLYTLLASKEAPVVPWAQTFFFFSDERYVPPSHPDSNFRMADEALLSKLRLPPQNVFRVPTEAPDPEAAAQQYEQALQSYFALSPGQFPRFDLILLGLGPDGHTASLFPGTPALRQQSHLVTSNRVEKLSADRITFTYPVINHAACVVFLVSGRDKAGILREVFENDKADLPAQKVRPANGKLLWLIDRGAASSLSGEKV